MEYSWQSAIEKLCLMFLVTVGPVKMVLQMLIQNMNVLGDPEILLKWLFNKNYLFFFSFFYITPAQVMIILDSNFKG